MDIDGLYNVYINSSLMVMNCRSWHDHSIVAKKKKNHMMNWYGMNHPMNHGEVMFMTSARCWGFHSPHSSGSKIRFHDVPIYGSRSKTHAILGYHNFEQLPYVSTLTSKETWWSWWCTRIPSETSPGNGSRSRTWCPFPSLMEGSDFQRTTNGWMRSINIGHRFWQRFPSMPE